MTLRPIHRFTRRVALLAMLTLAAALALEGTDARSDPVAVTDSVAAPATDFGAFFAAFLAQRPDSSRTAYVSRLSFERDAGRFTLEDGNLWLSTPVNGRVCTAVFVGRGTFSLTPPTVGEREQVRRTFGTTSVERTFSALVLVMGDSTLAELDRSLDFAPGRGSKLAARTLAECIRYVSDAKTSGIKPSLARPFLEGRATGYFFSLIESVDAARLFYEIDPERVEDVTLWREPKNRHIGLWRVWRRDDVAMFARGGVADSAADGDTWPVLGVLRHRLECRIAGNMDFSAVAEIECESRGRSPQRWATVTLFEKLLVDSVAWVGGAPARFHQGKESDRVWVTFDPPLAPGEKRTLRLRYHGRLIDRYGDWMLLGSLTGWYPEPDGRHMVPFDVTFHSPSQYHLVSVGERVSTETRGNVTTSRWRSERPTRNVTFVLGLFDEEAFGLPDAPPVTALMFRGKPEPIEFAIDDDERVRSGARMDRKVAADAGRAVAFFNRVLGPPPAPRIVVAEIPDNKGVAFPGLIQLTWTYFKGRNVAAEDAVFRAHEVAHQWWAYGVGYRTYRDHWLSEGFADFSGLWYVQQGLGDTKSYLSVLDAWREQIFDDLRDRPKDAPPAGPISVGYRAASVEAPGDHGLVIYKKGAWVLHMLRNMLLDLDTGDDQRFGGLMRDFYARHEGRTATTEEFRKVAQRYAGEDLGWFFDQWVYGTDLPTYRFASRTDRTPDGKYRVTCRVEQLGVPETFRMPLPIRIDFEDGKVAWVRALIQGAKTEFELPLLDRAPKAVVFNDLQSVLCKVEQVKW